MADMLVAKFGGKKRAPKFADEGEPDMGDSGRGGASGAGDENPSSDELGAGEPGGVGGSPDDMASGGYGDEEKTLDDLSDILGVGPEDRDDFANALKAYVSSCIEAAMGGSAPEGEGAMPPGMDSSSGGPPAEEEP